MTLRTIESQFAHLLMNEMKNIQADFDLRQDSLVIRRWHPKIISSRLRTDQTESTVSGWEFDCFNSLSEARKKYPEITLEMTGHPWKVFEFLNSSNNQAIINFSPLGIAVLSRNVPLSVNSKSQLRMEFSHWLSYALSNELWGPEGKWPRFHARMKHLFETKKLLVDSDFPGYYPLNKECKRLEAHGFTGSELPHSYVLVLPWTFPLSALEKLETIIQQEF